MLKILGQREQKIVNLKENSLEELATGEVDNLNTSIKDEESENARNQNSKKQEVEAKEVQNRGNKVIEASSQKVSIFSNAKDFNLKQSPIKANEKKNQQENVQQEVQQNSNKQQPEESKKALNSIFKKTRKKTTAAERQIKSKINSEKSLGYEKYRKGFEATSRGSIKLAELHHKAKKIKKIDLKDIENSQFCDCCGLPIEGEQYRFDCDVDDFADFGVGFSLYFIYLKFVIILLVVAFIPFGMTLLVLCLRQNNNDINNANQQSFLALKSSIGSYVTNEEDNQLPIYFGIFQLVNLIFMTGAVSIFKWYCQKKELEIDLKFVQPKDYTVWLKNLPNGISKEQLKTFIEKLGRNDGKKSEVVKILFPIQLQQYMKLVNKYKKLQLKKASIDVCNQEGSTLKLSGCKW